MGMRVGEKDMRGYRKDLRNGATDAEKILWQYLRKSQIYPAKFRRQQSIGPFIVDFYCPTYKLIVEVDGGYHLSTEAQERDRIRDYLLRKDGYRVMRFTNEQVFREIEKVVGEIRAFVAPTPSPSLGGEG